MVPSALSDLVWTNQSKPPVYIRQSQVINAAGSCIHDVLTALHAKRSCLESFPDIGLVARLPESVQRNLGHVMHDSWLAGYDPATLLAVLTARAFRPFIDHPDICATIIGSSRGNTKSLEEQLQNFIEKKPLAITTSPATTMGSLAAGVARDIELGGMQLAVSSACSTSMQSTIVGVALIRSQITREAIVGGSEYATTPFTLAMLRRIRIYHRYDDQTYTPFHPHRSGMVLGDGCALHLLTTVKDGAIAEILGVGSHSERSTLTGLSTDGQALIAAIHAAMADAGLGSSEIHAIVAHGAGTKRGDAAELAAYHKIFGHQLPPLICDKWCFGHTLGAASATSLASAIEISRTGEVYEMPDTKMLPDVIGKGCKIKQGGNVLVTALGFGGGAAAILVRAV